ncbi:MAG: tRNA (adenosine(37)-N6)-dimethylallyltransferase MiaA [Phycisphaerales bacterium]
MLRRFPVIVGPTAGGKSALGVALARALTDRGQPAEIVTADSMQVYRGMDIGTAKPTPEERGGIPHHLIDVVEPTASFSVDRWLTMAEGLIDALRGRGVVPIVVGGTHLYVKALLDGLFEGPPADASLRASLSAMGAAALRKELERIDPDSAARIHPNDERRTVRAIEVFRLTGTPLSVHQRQWDDRGRADALLVGLRWGAEALNRRINARVKAMIEAGLVEEVRGLWSAGRLGEQARQALGYKQLVDHFEGRCSADEALEKIKIETRRFAKNQRTWLRRLSLTPGSVWLDAGAGDGDGFAQVIAEKTLSDQAT